MKRVVVFLIAISLFSCKSNRIKHIEPYVGNTKKMTLPVINFKDTFNVTYYINDTISTLYISHRECTECLDAFVDRGIVYIPDSVAHKILKFYKERNTISTNGKDLKLIGKGKIDEELFGNQDNFMNKWHDRFLIRGKVIDITDRGLLFFVNDYVNIYDE